MGISLRQSSVRRRQDCLNQRADIRLGDGDFQAKVGKCLQILGHEERIESELQVEVALVAHAVDGDSLRSKILDQREGGVEFRVATVFARDVIVVITEQRRRISRVRPTKCVGNDAWTQVRDPEIRGVELRRIRVGEHFVENVPLPDPAAVTAHLGDDVLM